MEKSDIYYNDLNASFNLKNKNESEKIDKNLRSQIEFWNNYFTLYIFCKLLFGIIIISIPYLFFLYLYYNEDLEKFSKFLFIGYFITLSFIAGISLIFSIFKTGNSFKIYGFFFKPWERKYIFKLVNLFFISVLCIGFFHSIENFYSDILLIKETIEQNPKYDPKFSKKFNQGTYIMRFLFIFIFWDTEKDVKTGEYIHNKIQYFEYEQSFGDFRELFNSFFIPFIYLLSYLFLRLLIFKIKYCWLNSIIIFCGLFECFYFVLFPIDDSDNNLTKVNDIDYFKKDYKLIALEFLPLVLLFVSFIIYSYIETIRKLINKKLFPRKTQKIYIIVIIIASLSFIISFIGYGILIFFVVYFIFFLDINEEMSIKIFFNFWFLLRISLLLICFGNSFSFGNYFFKMIYKPIEFEIYDYPKKNENYIKTSYNLKNKKNKYLKDKKRLFPERW